MATPASVVKSSGFHAQIPVALVVNLGFLWRHNSDSGNGPFSRRACRMSAQLFDFRYDPTIGAHNNRASQRPSHQMSRSALTAFLA
jgi:hypothetical protein